jgi:toxin ParE1/3/4
MNLTRSNQSDQDIESIADYIAQDTPRAALKWIIEIEEKLESIAAAPGIGRARPNVQDGLRTFAFGNHLICYTQTNEGVEIQRVFHGARMWQDLL